MRARSEIFQPHRQTRLDFFFPFAPDFARLNNFIATPLTI
jgi:hypothetical protein